MSGIDEIKSRLQAFKKRYYLRKILIGSLLFLITAAVLFLVVNGLEYKLWMGTAARSVLFFSGLTLLSCLIYFLILQPLIYVFKLKRGISDEEAAKEISRSFPEIQDRLLNTLQLSRLSREENELLSAAIDKKTEAFKNIPFIKAVDFSLSKRYAMILVLVILCLSLVSFINPAIFSSTERIVQFNKEFTPNAPFSFLVESELEAFKGEDFELNVKLQGASIPEKITLELEGRGKLRLRKTSSNSYVHVFPKVQKEISFRLEGAGFYSIPYKLKLNNRPDLVAMSILIQDPVYTGGERRRISNTGNISVLEGGSVSWELSTLSSDSLAFSLGSRKLSTSRSAENSFSVGSRVFESNPYKIDLFNKYGKNSSELLYMIEVTKDKKPTISAESFPDSSMYQFVTIAGNILDDHGFSELRLNYRKKDEPLKSVLLDLAIGVKKQSFFSNLSVDTLNLSPGDRLEFYVSVSDNDRVNGAKTSRSRTFLLQIPSDEEIEKIIDKKSQTVENQIDKSKLGAEDINDRLKKVEEKLKAEQSFDWQEKKQLEDIIEDREELEKQIQNLQKQHKELQRSSDQFNKRGDQAKQQNEQLQKLLDELLDEKTKELYEQLKELLKDKNASSDQVREQLQDIQKNEKNLEKELDRALELFKRLKMESALEQNLQKLDTLRKRQEKLAKEDEESLSDQELTEEQKDIQEHFEDFREKMDEVEKLNQELKRPEALQDFELEERQIAKELREIQEQLDQQENAEGNEKENQSDTGDPQQGEENENAKESDQDAGKQKDSSESEDKKPGGRQQIQQKQKKASQRMQQLTQQLTTMQSGMQMEMMQANLDQLRDILDNLVKLSFNQEELMTEMRQVNQSDPRFLELSQNQLKLKDDAKVIQDSLLSLAKKVVQISSFITREVGNINENIDEALDFLKDRNRGRALSSQQFAMTSINNLALLLDDTMQQMQMAMSEAMGNPSKGEKKQQGLPDLQALQKQLGENINELKGSGKEGRELSEELAKLAAQQEMIRRQLEMIQQAEEGQPGGSGGNDLQKAIDQMEQNEVDLVNKRLTQQLINRQKNIETRLLEAEKAEREQEQEEEREAESPSTFSREVPPQFEEYLKIKQKEIELLKTIPLELNPFYKKEVNDYFRRISSDIPE